MNKKFPLPHPDRESFLKHKRETNRQILLPVVLSSLVIVALFVLVAYATFGQNGDVARWAAISTIWIVFPLMILMLGILILLMAMAYGLHKLLQESPDYTGAAQEYILRINAKIQWYAKEMTNRVIRFRAWVETLQSFLTRG